MLPLRRGLCRSHRAPRRHGSSGSGDALPHPRHRSTVSGGWRGAASRHPTPPLALVWSSKTTDCCTRVCVWLRDGLVVPQTVVRALCSRARAVRCIVPVLLLTSYAVALYTVPHMNATSCL